MGKVARADHKSTNVMVEGGSIHKGEKYRGGDTRDHRVAPEKRQRRGEKVRFEQPYYVSPHAVQRFRERVACLSTRKIRVIIQSSLQRCKQFVGYQVYDRQQVPVYSAQYKGIEYLIVVRKEKKKKNAWLVVPTILVPGMKIYTGRRWKGENTDSDTANT